MVHFIDSRTRVVRFAEPPARDDSVERMIKDLGEQIFHVVLDADELTLRNRIEHDQLEVTGRQWRLDYIAEFATAREWMIREADLIIDTSRLAVHEVVSRIAGEIPAEHAITTAG